MKKFFVLFLLVLLCASLAHAQGTPTPVYGKEASSVTATQSDSASCTPGEIRFSFSTNGLRLCGTGGTWSAISGGGGGVSSVGLSMPPDFTVSSTPITTSGTFGVTRTTETISFSATPTFNCKQLELITLTGNVTSSTLTGCSSDGQLVKFRIAQDATGGRTFVWPTNVQGGPSLDTSSNRVNYQTFRWDATSSKLVAEGPLTTDAGDMRSLGYSATDATGPDTLTCQSAPSSPASGKLSSWCDTTDQRYHDKNNGGTIGTTVVASTAGTNQFATAVSTAGVVTYTQPSSSNLSDASSLVKNNQANSYSGGGLQDLNAMKVKLPKSTVASLPAAASNTDVQYMVTDGNSASDCTAGSGSTRVWCVSNGSAWVAFGDGGAGGSGLGDPGTNGVVYRTGLNTTAAAKQDQIEGSGTCSDVGASDAYACNLSPAISSYAAGTHYRFKANTINTGAATLNLNSLGAKTIKKAVACTNVNLSDGDIRPGRYYDVTYDGTDMLLEDSVNGINGAMPMPNAGRWSYWVANTSGGFTQVGDVFAATGTASNAAPTASTSQYISYVTTATTVGTDVGYLGGTPFRAGRNYQYQWVGKTQQSIESRWFFGLSNAGSFANQHGSATPSFSYCGFRLEAGVDTNLQAACDNGSGAPTLVDLGGSYPASAITTQHKWEFVEDANAATPSVTFCIDNVNVANITTKLPSGVNLGINNGGRITTAGSNKNLDTAAGMVKSDF